MTIAGLALLLAGILGGLLMGAVSLIAGNVLPFPSAGLLWLVVAGLSLIGVALIAVGEYCHRARPRQPGRSHPERDPV